MAHDSEWLRSAFAQLPSIDGESFWDAKRSELRDMVRAQDPAYFLRWPTIISTMFVGNAPYIEGELAALPASHVIRDSGFGAPELHPSGSSGNLIHQAYHLYRWERATGRTIQDVRSIVEFGGGYGAMTLVALRRGFTGSYQIVDYPEFCLLQQYYLSNVWADIRQITWTDAQTPQGCDLFIACHSLSETPLDVRRQILEHIRANSYLFVYHCEHEGVDNLKYFAEFAESKPGLSWHRWVTEHPSNQVYMVGGKHESSR